MPLKGGTVMKFTQSIAAAAFALATFGILPTSASFVANALPNGVPEPITLSLFCAGLLGMGFIYRRRAIKRAKLIVGATL
jgi:hypothetical protein